MKYRPKYKTRSNRADFWDYGDIGLYFITICTRNKKNFFGQVIKEEMVPNETGLIAQKNWYDIPKQFPFAELDDFILMPNHLHGVIGLYNYHTPRVGTRFIAFTPPEEPTATPLPGGITGTKNPMGKASLGEVIRWFKGRTTFDIRKSNKDFAWQPRYYDHIIRDAERYEYICNYIIYNPENWKKIYSS